MRFTGLVVFLTATAAFADLSKTDLDGDGRISKAEAAGNADLMGIFDRADRDRDGRLTQAEIDDYEKWLAARKAGTSASAGGTKAKTKEKARKKD